MSALGFDGCAVDYNFPIGLGKHPLKGAVLQRRDAQRTQKQTAERLLGHNRSVLALGNRIVDHTKLRALEVIVMALSGPQAGAVPPINCVVRHTLSVGEIRPADAQALLGEIREEAVACFDGALDRTGEEAVWLDVEPGPIWLTSDAEADPTAPASFKGHWQPGGEAVSPSTTQSKHAEISRDADVATTCVPLINLAKPPRSVTANWTASWRKRVSLSSSAPSPLCLSRQNAAAFSQTSSRSVCSLLQGSGEGRGASFEASIGGSADRFFVG
eukprot:CAMPEP_0115476138 /NCGR_PEP_ID=MMETSP0271-20121206/54979_1 /TAXON_ID=71861 /ORGANISM="Scrippsiella trochoidea, Strain CCMP3099" /LENGTH=271 /DNA_ID=CAMNT_0002903535 /DNA_START=606 /DNA_END=1422 /DNA_ORIENTATION=+